MRGERWYTAVEAVEAGLADQVADAKPGPADPAKITDARARRTAARNGRQVPAGQVRAAT